MRKNLNQPTTSPEIQGTTFTRDPPTRDGSTNTGNSEKIQNPHDKQKSDLKMLKDLGFNLNEVDDVTRTWLEAMNFDKMGFTQKAYFLGNGGVAFILKKLLKAAASLQSVEEE
ncbi:hypothetical protein AMATHDRAFT_9961 [Amanita thiersii Skay4041]|uniref:Uncharacterized protein n=1 Tax=Amanita thiersii Skay4041 TaxID=703135 RepID=A0A2A9NBH9_9AGAR|nr:hypothetical protein AMATHDRAFT_9961 [Amanita thiersii Skay4041]